MEKKAAKHEGAIASLDDCDQQQIQKILDEKTKLHEVFDREKIGKCITGDILSKP